MLKKVNRIKINISKPNNNYQKETLRWMNKINYKKLEMRYYKQKNKQVNQILLIIIYQLHKIAYKTNITIQIMMKNIKY